MVHMIPFLRCGRSSSAVNLTEAMTRCFSGTGRVLALNPQEGNHQKGAWAEATGSPSKHASFQQTAAPCRGSGWARAV